MLQTKAALSWEIQHENAKQKTAWDIVYPMFLAELENRGMAMPQMKFTYGVCLFNPGCRWMDNNDKLAIWGKGCTGMDNTGYMLAHSESDEETAAVWIAATIQELYHSYAKWVDTLKPYLLDTMLRQTMTVLYDFRQTNWHHRSSSFIPDVKIPEIVQNASIKTVVQIAVDNMIRVTENYQIMYTIFESEMDRLEKIAKQGKLRSHQDIMRAIRREETDEN